MSGSVQWGCLNIPTMDARQDTYSSEKITKSELDKFVKISGIFPNRRD